MQPQPQPNELIRLLLAFSDNPVFGGIVGIGFMLIVASVIATFNEKVISPIYKWLFKPILPDVTPPPEVAQSTQQARLNDLLDIIIYDRLLEGNLLENRVDELDRKFNQLLESYGGSNYENPEST